jgi:uncharacterized protein (DUF4415 family)
MSRKLVKVAVDLAALPPLTAEQEAELAALAAMPDDAIDTSDIPATTEAFWRNAERGRFYRPVKESTTVRLDRDVLHWLRSKGRGYQTRINAILREAMMREGPGR